MNTEHLEYLLDLEKTLSLSRTAENYYTSHQVISHAVKALEKEFHIKILHRSNQGVQFTEAGTFFLDYAKSVLQRKQSVTAELARYAEPVSPAMKGALTIYFIPRFSNKKFISLFNTFQRKNPQINVTLKNMSLHYILDNITLTDSDIILAAMDQRSQTSNIYQEFCSKLDTLNLTMEIFHSAESGICISKNSKYMEYFLSADTFEAAIEAYNIPIVSFDYQFEKQSLPIDYPITLIDNFEMQKDLIKRGQHVTQCTEFEFNEFLKSSSLLFLPYKDCIFNYLAIYKKDSRNNAIINSFIQELKKI